MKRRHSKNILLFTVKGLKCRNAWLSNIKSQSGIGMQKLTTPELI